MRESSGNKKISVEHIVEELKIFRKFDHQQKDFIKENADVIHLQREELLLKKDDASDYVYIVYSGRLVVSSNHMDWKNNLISTLGHNDIIGEISLITEENRTASIIANRASTLLRIPNAVMKEILFKDSNLMAGLLKIITSRLIKHSPDSAISGRLNYHGNRVMALIPSGGHDATEYFLHNVLPKLKEYCRVIYINLEYIKSSELGWLDAYDDLSDYNLLLSRMLSHLEHKYDLIFLCPDYELTEWSIACLHNCDDFIFVAEATKSNELSPLERFVLEHSSNFVAVSKEQVMIHKNNSVPTNTRQWIGSRHRDSIYHISDGSDNTIYRLARILTEKSVSLTLSGGGPMGYSHIGVLKALEEYNIDVDILAGASSGSLAAALYAKYHDVTIVQEIAKELYSKLRRNRWLYYQIPIFSLLKPKTFEKILQPVLGDIDMEDLLYPLLLTASDLITYEEVVFLKGPLLTILSASNALPGIMSPVILGEQLLIDGGACNTMPVDIVKSYFSGTSIAVNATRSWNISIEKNVKEFPSTQQLMKTYLSKNKSKVTLPRLHEIIASSIIIANKRKLEQVKPMADILIEPNFSNIRRITNREIDKLIDAGYTEAIKQLDKKYKKE